MKKLLIAAVSLVSLGLAGSVYANDGCTPSVACPGTDALAVVSPMHDNNITNATLRSGTDQVVVLKVTKAQLAGLPRHTLYYRDNNGNNWLPASWAKLSSMDTNQDGYVNQDENPNNIIGLMEKDPTSRYKHFIYPLASQVIHVKQTQFIEQYQGYGPVSLVTKHD